MSNMSLSCISLWRVKMSDRYILALEDEVFYITDSANLKKSKEDFEKEFYDVWVEDDNLYTEEEIERIVSGEYNDYLIENSMSGKEITDRLNNYSAILTINDMQINNQLIVCEWLKNKCIELGMTEDEIYNYLEEMEASNDK